MQTGPVPSDTLVSYVSERNEVIFIKVFQELNILILILGDKEPEKHRFRLHICEGGDKNEKHSRAWEGRARSGDERVSKAGEEYARRVEPQKSSKMLW